MVNIPKQAPRRRGRLIDDRFAKPRAGARRGPWIGLGLGLLAALWPVPSARAQQDIQLDLSYEAEKLVPPEALLGEWRAVISRNGKPQPVTLTIKDVTPGNTAGKMVFASPRRCYIDLEYGGPDQGRHIFYIIRFTNCFEYGRSDFVALSQVPGDDVSEAESRRRRNRPRRHRGADRSL